ncbi:hypothetical protein MLD38_020832 [Melastoma candidum]|nr:hypothetical protein MLD38_020832 [Melastoma candidum]
MVFCLSSSGQANWRQELVAEAFDLFADGLSERSQEKLSEARVGQPTYGLATIGGELQLPLQERPEDLFLAILYLVNHLQTFGQKGERDWDRETIQKEVGAGVGFSNWDHCDDQSNCQEDNKEGLNRSHCIFFSSV